MSDDIPDDVCIAFFTPAGPYHYLPSLGAAITFTILFAGSAIHHLVASIRARRWWQFVFTIGGIAETLGWASRIWSYKCPYQLTPFLIQTSTLIFAPAFFTAGLYIILGRLILLFGPGVSPLRPRTYLIIFCSIDFVSLLLQAVGGGLASSALSATPQKDASTGNNTMLTGIVFQLAATLVFAGLFVSVLMRARRAEIPQALERKVVAIQAATAVSVTLVIIRGIYRTVELSQGWNGYLMSREGYMIALDGLTMALAVLVFNFVSPGWAEASETGARGEKNASETSTVANSQV